MAAVAPSPTFFLVMAVAAFAIPLIFLWWVRNTPRFGREPVRAVLHVFGWGAFVSVVIALILELVFTAAAMEITPLYTYLAAHFVLSPDQVFGFLIAAPFVEEAAKGLGVRTARRTIHSVEDGLVYGAAAGFGFSAMENLLYGLSYWLYATQNGIDPNGSLLLIVVRSFSSSLFHASATATMGYGITKAWLTRRRYAYVPFYIAAVLMHATFNYTVNLKYLYPGALAGLIDYVAFFAAVVFAVIAITIVRFRLVMRRPDAAR